MSRSSFVVACALVIVLGVMLSKGPAGQKKALAEQEKAQSTQPTRQSAEERIESVLDEQLLSSLEFVETPLLDIVAQLEEDCGIQIQFDTAALNDVAISPDTEITINLSHVALRSALDLMLRQPGLEDLTYIIDKEVLLITTRDVADATLLTKVYRVDDFEHFSHSKSESGASDSCYSFLLDVIVSCIDFCSWKENGTGEGEIHLMKPGLLVVSQTRSVHRKIEKLIDDLREAKAEIDGGSGDHAY